jgi:molybdopterin molybdotransferase
MLSNTLENSSDLTVFVGVETRINEGRVLASLVEGNGSGDLVNLSKIDGFVQLDPGHLKFSAGTLVPFIATKTRA